MGDIGVVSAVALCQSRAMGSLMPTGILILVGYPVARSFDVGSILANCFATVGTAHLVQRPYSQTLLVLVGRPPSLHHCLVALRPHPALIRA